MLTWWHFLIIFGIAFIVTALLVPAVRSFAIKHGYVDQPGPRRVNKEPIPRLGGIAMFFGMLAAFVVEYACERFGVWPGTFSLVGGSNVNMLGVVIGFTVVVALGAIDDMQSLRPGVKFGGQIIAAIIIVSSGVVMAGFKMPLGDARIDLGILAYPVTVIYLVAFANVVNLIDGLDGLAAGITGIAGIGMYLLTASLFHNDASLMAAVLVAICAAFLIYNFNPASIFMGDSGSLLLGMMLGTISLVGATRFSSITALAVPVMIAGVPVIDTAGAIIRRLRGHQPIQQADRGHIHHRLLDQGFSQRTSVVIIYLWTAVLCVGGYFVWNLGGTIKYAILIGLFVVSGLIVWRLGLLGPVLHHHYYPDFYRAPKGSTAPFPKIVVDEEPQGGGSAQQGDSREE